VQWPLTFFGENFSDCKMLDSIFVAVQIAPSLTAVCSLATRSGPRPRLPRHPVAVQFEWSVLKCIGQPRALNSGDFDEMRPWRNGVNTPLTWAKKLDLKLYCRLFICLFRQQSLLDFGALCTHVGMTSLRSRTHLLALVWTKAGHVWLHSPRTPLKK
jgi:hypothetical protein